MKRILLAGLFIAMQPAHAGVVIFGTRVVYPAEKQEVVVQLMNHGARSSLVQSWIDDGNTSLPPEKINVPFLLSPPVARITGNSGQQLRIKKLANKLPANKESLFYLNVLDIPPNTPGSEGANTLRFAMQNRIKLFYRPKGIAAVNKDTFKSISLSSRKNALHIANGSANWFTITEIKLSNVKVNERSVMLAPLSSQDVILKNNLARQYSLTMIDDNGNFISDRLNVK
ncbi:fimbria/pilus periplasmic chaperone [Klebsiella aerogenes]